MASTERRDVRLEERVVLLQFALGVASMAAFFIFASDRSDQGQAAFAALLTVILPSSAHVWLQRKTRSATRLLLLGVLRMIGTVLLMVVSLGVFSAAPLGYFVTLVVMQLAYVAGLKIGPKGS